MNRKKLMIILALTLFMLQVSYASDINETVGVEINDIVVEEIIEVDETNELVLYEDNIDETINDEIVDDNTPHKEYIDSNINNSYEKYFEVEICYNQYCTYTDVISDESFDNHTEFDETDKSVSSLKVISYKDFTGYQLLVCNKLEFNFETDYFDDFVFKFDELKEFGIKIQSGLKYSSTGILTHFVNKNIVFCSDKLNSKFVYSIDNSIVGSASKFQNYLSDFCFINYPQSSQYFLTSFYLIEYVYDFFSVLNNQINEVCSFRI